MSVDPEIWKACAGNSGQMPSVESRVYYFPQGHAEHSSAPPDFSKAPFLPPPFLHCRISSVRFLASNDTDEVFAKILLQPIPPPDTLLSSQSSHPHPLLSRSGGGGAEAVSFAKILTPSDANNGGGFSVPRFCADSIFPPLNFNAEPPVQTVSIRDVHGTPWEFRHIYRGTPRRHLLTTGWSKFVNHKKLVAGDSVLFIKHPCGELFVGVRRARPHPDVNSNSNSNSNSTRWPRLADDGGGEEGFRRNYPKGKLSPESILEAVQLASAGRPFEVLYYPNSGLPDFVVRAEAVEDSMKVYWSMGLRVKMAMETEDSSRMTWFQGTVSSVAGPDIGVWRGSPWRSLQVTWDEPEALQNVKRVSPWEVELVSATPQMQAPFTSPKKMKLTHEGELLADGESPMFLPMMGLSHMVIGNVNPSLFNYNTFPAGMQGARQNQMFLPSFSNFLPEDNSLLYSDKLCGNNLAKELSPVSTELNIGSASPSNNSSLPVEGTAHLSGMQPNAGQTPEPKRETGSTFIQLFGQIIQTKQTVDDDNESVGCGGDDSSRGCEEAVGQTLEYSISYPFKQLFNQYDSQRQSVSAVGASL